MRIKKLVIIIFLSIIVYICTACHEQQELADIGIVIATGLDWENEQVVLTTEVTIPLNRVEQSEESNSMILQERGDTVMEAIRNVTLNFDRKLFFSHNTVIIFGEDFAKKGIASYLDFFTKDNEPRENAFLAVAKGAKAYELIGINDGLSGTTGEYLESLFENTIFTLKGRGLTINEFFKYYYDREAPLLGVVERRDIIDVEPVTGELGTKSMLDVRGGAPFYKDKIIGYYTEDEMIGFNFIVDEVEEGIIVFEAPMELMEYSNVFASSIGKYTTFEITSSKTKKEIEIRDGKPHLKIHVDAKGLIVEDNRGLNTSILEVRDGVQDACGNKIKEHIANSIDKAQDLKTDSFSINHLFRSTYPKEYNRISDSWHHEFSKIDYSINVKVRILRTGLTNTPTNLIKGEEY